MPQPSNNHAHDKDDCWRKAHRNPRRWQLKHADCLKALPRLQADSIDAIITDPPYGLEFMGKEWDSFRCDHTGTRRHRGKLAGSHGTVNGDADGNHPAQRKITVAYGGGRRTETYRCNGCGTRDQFRGIHACGPRARWIRELVDPFAAPPTMLAFENWCRRVGARCNTRPKAGRTPAGFRWHTYTSSPSVWA